MATTPPAWDYAAQANPMVVSDAPLPPDGAGFVVNFRLREKPVLVVNGGFEALSRILSCLDALARVSFISPSSRVHPKVRKLLDLHPMRHLIEYHDREIDLDSDMDAKEWALVLSCYEPEEEDEERSATRNLYRECKKRRIVVNCADVPECCDFHIPTTLRDGPVQISVSTSGFAPGLSRRIKKSLLASLDPNTGQAVTNCGKLREKLKTKGVERTRRIKFMTDAQKKWSMRQWAGMKGEEVEDVAGKVARGEDVTPPAVGSEVSEGSEAAIGEDTKALEPAAASSKPQPAPAQPQESTESIASLPPKPLETVTISQPSSTLPSITPTHLASLLPPPSFSFFHPTPSTPSIPGTILLLGGGPGHPSHLTLSCLSSLLLADHVVSDRLVGPSLLDWVPGLRAKTTFVAEKSGSGGASDAAQMGANETCLAKLVSIQRADGDDRLPLVARLKNGDPFLFARGMEEVAWFTSRGVRVGVAPGVPSATSAALAAGIAVTHRGVADCVSVVTARGEGGYIPELPEWTNGRTAVVLMGLGRLAEIVKAFGAKGWPESCPVAVVQKAWWEDGNSGSLQKVVRATMITVAEAVKEAGLESPVAIVVGDAVAVGGGEWKGIGELTLT